MQQRALVYQSYIGTMASETSALELLSMQQVSIQRYLRPICEAIRQLVANFAKPFFDCTSVVDGEGTFESTFGVDADSFPDRGSGVVPAVKSAKRTSSSRHRCERMRYGGASFATNSQTVRFNGPFSHASPWR